jgi:hypothetical protein
MCRVLKHKKIVLSLREKMSVMDKFSHARIMVLLTMSSVLRNQHHIVNKEF